MTQNNPNQPIYILPEGHSRTVGRDAQRNNILAAKIVAETVRTTLGPKGMDKMLVDSMGDVIVTNDGVTILKEMQIEHPAAKMIVEVAKTQEEEVGDGTTTAVVLAGEFLKNAEALIDKNIHPTVISKGYRLAAEKSQKILNAMAEPITSQDKELLIKIANTAMTGKGAESSKELLSKIVVDAVTQVEENKKINSKDIKVEKKVGSGIEDSELIKGIVIDKERVHSSMPKSLEKVNILLLDTAIEVKSTETDAKIQITSPDQMDAFLKQEETMIKKMTEKIKESGANAVFCQKGIDDLAQYYLAKEGIYAARRVKKSDMENLARATGASIVNNIETITPEVIGYSGIVEELKVGDEQMTYIKECKNPKAVTILVRGGTEHVVAEVERAVVDAIGDVISAIEDGKVVAGAGAPEVELSKQLKDYANTLSGREQLAVNAFAEALEVIPRTLAENAGLDPIDVLTSLKSSHDKNEKFAGINVFTGKVMDSWEAGVLEPLRIKTQAVKSASEVTELILRIDDVIASGESSRPSMPPGGMPGMGM
ncbi:thermosome subunit [Candidatus Woesearchaeota archaeon]|jgi:thermosome|nr:thermosome subunit [Candidatus Woesearchaeota archaeon]MBT3438757.1 thermosome subunit [Candidatus Woesearchaeota archaeon]MBT4058454.1 thermosome subunit [Candidatus Woesearchaeota archaeon]MBT4208757.1 thermosome subunit [Candidatus Woesearchaeota archaeon]MBT4733154.1 thermosome subunit [Candidatus Woesearchaeota archaeon]